VNKINNEEVLKEILEQSLAGYWDWDIPSGNEYLSPSFKQMFGYEDHEIENRAESWQKLIFAEDLPGVLENFDLHVKSKGKVPFKKEVRYHHKDGSTVWVICTGKVIEWDDDGHARRMVGCHIDITERKQTELSYKRERDLNETLSSRIKIAMESANIAWWEMDIPTGAVVFDKKKTEMLGYEAEDFKHYKDFVSLIHPDDAEKAMNAMRTHLSGASSSYEIEYRIMSKSGIYKWFYDTGSITDRDVNGNAMKVVGFVINITERKVIEMMAKKEKTLGDTIIDSIPGTFYMLDENGRYVRWNAYQRDEIVGKPENMVADTNAIETIHPDDRAVIGSRIANVLKNGGDEIIEGRVLLRGGPAFRWLLMTGRRVVIEGCAYLLGIGIDITEQKRAEAALRESAEQMSVIVEGTPNLFFYMQDAEAKSTYVSPTVERITGYKPDAWLQKRDWFITDSPLNQTARERTRTNLRGEFSNEPISLEVRHALGHPIQLEAYEYPIIKDGKVIGLQGVVHDVSERKQAEEAQVEREVTLRTLADTGQALIWTSGLDKKCDYFNKPWLDFTGRALEQELGDGWVEGVHPDDLARCVEIYTSSFDRREKFSMDYRLRHASGEYRWIQDDGTPRYNSKGEFLGYIGHCLDISERKDIGLKLKESFDLLNNLAMLVPGVIYQYQLNPDGTSCFPYSSPGMKDTYECSPEEVKYDASPVFARLHPDDYDHVASLIFESAKTLNFFHCEYRVVLPRQGLGWRWSQAHPTRLPDGGTLWHGIISDITDRKIVEIEQEKLQAQLSQAQKMESVGRLAGGVAHDFNNMLGVILGYTEFAMEKVSSSEPLLADLEEIKQAAQRSADLTRQLLAFARKQTVALKVVDLNETIESMLKLLRRLIGEDIDLLWKPGHGLWPVMMDPAQIDQILANLCVNARDAIAGVGKVTIETGNVAFDEDNCALHAGIAPGDYTLLVISDDGCGMNKETISHLFEPFFTTKEMGKGTGLGLSTVYGVVKQNKGFINVYSEPGMGTTFKIYLPSNEAKAAAESKETKPQAVARGSETILLVEDEAAILRMTTLMLESLGYSVLAAPTPGEAIRLAKEYAGQIDLLMTDVVMPEMNGRDLARTLLNIYPDIKRLFMSGYTANVIAHHGVLDEGVHLIQKPFSKKDLGGKIREVLGNDA
jgi:PAS domain S-box-containing protein